MSSFATIRDLRDAVRSGARSAVEVCKDALDRIDAHNQALNAFNTMFDSNPGRTFGTLVTELAGFDLAYLHVVEEDGAPDSGPRFDVDGLRDLWNGPHIVNGNYDRSRAMKAIADGRADFVSFGKLFLANPQTCHSGLLVVRC